jgi:hypothetical protein
LSRLENGYDHVENGAVKPNPRAPIKSSAYPAVPRENRGIVMTENSGKIYADINRLPRVSNEAAIEILTILQEAAKEFPDISKYYVESKFGSDDRVSGGGFRYLQYVYDVQKWQKKWLGSTKK